ncbi:hypothetical protein JTB14_004607 [Gonioctena quinquepunctata]|nr:hypothetical protein JTB14_004607 [Gonioctena quinquepunctata]
MKDLSNGITKVQQGLKSKKYIELGKINVENSPSQSAIDQEWKRASRKFTRRPIVIGDKSNGVKASSYCRPSMKGGGGAIWAKNSLNTKIIDSSGFSIEQHIELNAEFMMIIVNCYCSHSGDIYFFIDIIVTVFERLMKFKTKTILRGYFDIDSYHISRDYPKLSTSLECYNLKPIVYWQTWITSRSKWNSNPHFCGSYVYVSLDQEEHNATADCLTRPVMTKSGKETLLFAGEATSTTQYSTVHGAIETGYREAERLISKYVFPSHRKIIIIGAGMAGLGAAHRLTELGFDDFLVIESQDRPGGRIKTIAVDGKSLDLGAQWLHGKENSLYELALKYNLLSNEISEEGSGKFVRNDGVIFDDFLVKRVDWEIGRIFEQCQTFIDKLEYPSSVGEFLSRKFTEYLDNCDDCDEVRQRKLQVFDWHLRFQVIDNSCIDLGKLSAKWWGTYVCEDGTAHYNLKEGYKSLVDVIVEGIPNRNIMYNTPLRGIQYKGLQIELACDNRTFVGDHLILTQSLGILKEFPDLDKLLPLPMKNSIMDMGFHSIGKIYMFFNEKWWGETKGFQFLWNSDEQLDDNEEWVRCLSGFEEVFDHPNCLLGWIGGKGVEKMEELSEDEVGNICVKMLRRFLTDYRVPDPSKIFRYIY